MNSRVSMALKEKLLTQHHASTARDISDAVTIKNGNIFALAQPNGQIPTLRRDRRHGLGVYFADCRYLDGYEFHVGKDHAPIPLIATSLGDCRATFQLTNDAPIGCGRTLVDKQELGLQLTRKLKEQHEGVKALLEDEFTFLSYDATSDTVLLPLHLDFSASFEDVFIVRGLLEPEKSEPAASEWKGNRLIFEREGKDGNRREVTLTFSPAPKRKTNNGADFEIPLRRGKASTLRVTLSLHNHQRAKNVVVGEIRKDLGRQEGTSHDSLSEELWMKREARVRSDSRLFNRTIDRAFRDLYMLKSHVGNAEFFSAGLPWFGTLFGRDSLLTAYHVLAFDPSIAKETLCLLARLQGQGVQAWNEEEPGKILHEFRQGELATAGIIPYLPFYGTVDATPLFILLLEHYYEWTGDIGLFKSLVLNVERALHWIRSSVKQGSGYLRYSSRQTKGGLINQGWKDSGNAIVTEKGKIADPPIALCEVQGYTWAAFQAASRLFSRIGDENWALSLKEDAEGLRSRFEKDFWIEDLGTYAMALCGKWQKPLRVRSSNPGHLLWAGIVGPDRAEKLKQTLLSPELFSGWGIRTLSIRERAYNPVGYHLGTVWPHENALIGAGLRKYGFDREAQELSTGIFTAASYFEDHRMPEAFSGFSRDDFATPVRYPVACHPQAWSASALPYLLISTLGLVPDAFRKRLRIVRPMLPASVNRLDLREIKVGEAFVSLRFHRHPDSVTVEVTELRGELEVLEVK